MYPRSLYVYVYVVCRMLHVLLPTTKIEDGHVCIVRLESTTTILRASGINLFVLYAMQRQ